MGYRDENETTTETLPVGCIFDGAMGWHNTYRIVDLAIAYGMDKDANYGWSENDAKIMAAYEASATECVLDDAEVLDEEGIHDTAQHWCEKAETYLQQFVPRFHYLTWDDGLYVYREDCETEGCDNDMTEMACSNDKAHCVDHCGEDHTR